MSLTSQSHVKFRPALTLEQMQYISSMLASPESSIELGIRKVLIPLIAKVEIGAVNPAYKLSEIHQAKLIANTQARRYETGEMTQDESDEYEKKVLGI